MPSPVTAEDFTISSFSGDICEHIRKLLELNDTLKTFFEWMFTDTGDLTSAFKALLQDVAVPIGAMVWRPLDAVPQGYLQANGQAVSRTTYANLFAVYGVTFGAGDGTTTFNVPAMQGRFALGKGPGGTFNVGSVGGSVQHTLTASEMPSHTHPITGTPSVQQIWGFNSSGGSFGHTAGGQLTQTVLTAAAAGGGQPHENMPPYMAGLWLVKY